MSMFDLFKIGRQFRVGEMLRMGPIRARMESTGISYTEFSYQILQSHDWMMLSKKFDCFFQVSCFYNAYKRLFLLVGWF
jgi:tyrosyl-tRNA synthetase